MKKLIFIILLLCSITFSYADGPNKKTIIVEDFITKSGHDRASEIAWNMHNTIIERLVKMRRFIVVNLEEDETAPDSIAEKYRIKGNVSLVTEERVMTQQYGVYTNKATFTLILTLYNDTRNSVIEKETIIFEGYNPQSKDLAINDAMENSLWRLEKIFNRNLPLITKVDEITKTTKKGDVKEFYIKGGSEMGVIEGQIFIVKLDATQIAKLKAKEVLANKTLCTISKGSKEINAIYHEDGNLSELIIIGDEVPFWADLKHALKQ